MPFFPLNGPALQKSISVGNATPKLIPESGSAMDGRAVITIMPIDGDIYVYFGDGTSTPSAATIIADGFPHREEQKDTYEASTSQPVYILSTTGTVKVITAERG